MPSYPPQGFGNSLDDNARRGPRHAEQFIDQLLDLNSKRRGINRESANKPRAASLNLSGNQFAQYASPNYDRLNHSTPFYDTFTDRHGLVASNLASPKNQFENTMRQENKIVGSSNPLN